MRSNAVFARSAFAACNRPGLVGYIVELVCQATDHKPEGMTRAILTASVQATMAGCGLFSPQQTLNDVEANRRLIIFGRGKGGVRDWADWCIALHVPIAANLPHSLDREAGSPDGLAVALDGMLRDSIGVIDSIARKLGERDLNSRLMAGAWRPIVVANAQRVSGIDPEQPLRSTKRIVRPLDQHGKTAGQLSEMYLAGTPFADTLGARVPFALDLGQLFEHVHLFGPSGCGKTTLIQAVLDQLLPLVAAGECSVMIIDSQRQLFDTMLGLRDFDPAIEDGLASRTYLADPADSADDFALTPRLSLFDFAEARDEARAVSLVKFVLKGLVGAELTWKQDPIFSYLAKLLMFMPDADLDMLIDVTFDIRKAGSALKDLDERSRLFFDREYDSSTYGDTPGQIRSRLHRLLGVPAFDRMFNNRVSSDFDLSVMFDRGSLVLVSTDLANLREDTGIVGRYFLAQAARAIFDRLAEPSRQHTPVILIMDEAQLYLGGNGSDTTAVDLLSMARKCRAGLLISHPYLDQLSDQVHAAVLGSVRTRIAGRAQDQDIDAVAKSMGTTGDFIRSLHSDGNRSRFALYVRDLMRSATVLESPRGIWNDRPKLDELERARLTAHLVTRWKIARAPTRDNVVAMPARLEPEQPAALPSFVRKRRA